MKPSIFCLSAVLASFAIAAAGPAQAEALAELRRFVSETHAASASFEQQTGVAQDGAKDGVKGGAVKLSLGTFVFQRPGKFVWTYEKPYRQVLQSDGVKIYIYDADLNQVTTRRLGDAIGSSPASILFGSNDLEKNFILTESGMAEGLAWLEARPKTQDMSFNLIRIGLTDGAPRKMELFDNFGKKSILSFSGLKKNPALSEATFRFQMPAGADVLEN